MKGSRRKVRGSGKSSVYELRVYAGRAPVTNKPKYISRTVTGSAKDADAALRKLVEEVGRVDHTGPGESFGVFLDRWLKVTTTLKDRSATTTREYRRIINKTIKPAIGDVQLREIDGRVLDDLYVSLRTRKPPLSPASVRRVHALVSAACAWAVKRRELLSNPANQATPPSVPHSTKEAPTLDDVRLLIQTAEQDDPDMAAFIALAAVTGARRGELCGLRWGDVDEDLGTLSIARSYAVVGGQHIFKPTKTHGVRRIALGEFGLEVLRRQRLRLEERAEDVGLELGDDTPILTYDLVDPISPDTASHYVRAIARTAGVDTHLHALRHFLASEMIADGQDVRTVAGRLGHADASTTLEVYAHMLPQRDLKAAESLGRSLSVGGS
jgi:integrase